MLHQTSANLRSGCNGGENRLQYVTYCRRDSVPLATQKLYDCCAGIADLGFISLVAPQTRTWPGRGGLDDTVQPCVRTTHRCRYLYLPTIPAQCYCGHSPN